MPLTLPAHAAAVLPLLRLGGGRWLPPTALVVGSCVPDLAYLAGLSSRSSHTLLGLVRFSLPVGLLTLVWLEVLVLPVLRSTVPELGGVQWGRFLRTRGLPQNAREWALAAVAVWLGAAIHALWDGFTHRYRWPASELYPEALVLLGPWEWPLATVLQHASSIAGTLVVFWAMAGYYPRLPEARGGCWRDFLLVLAPTLAVPAAALGLRLEHAPQGASIEGLLRWFFWHVVDGVLLGLTLGCAVAGLSSRLARGASGRR